MSRETAADIIERSKEFDLFHSPSESKVASSELVIWRFKDSSGRPRFFIQEVRSLTVPSEFPKFTKPEFFAREQKDR